MIIPSKESFPLTAKHGLAAARLLPDQLEEESKQLFNSLSSLYANGFDREVVISLGARYLIAMVFEENEHSIWEKNSSVKAGIAELLH